LVPSSVEFIGKWCFERCGSLSSLTFDSPSNLRELLHVPRYLPDFLAIPDAVEILWLEGTREDLDRTLTFGVDSRLREIRAESSFHECRSFLQVSTGSLKLFRQNFEFSA
jgi:hypothetical protein